jgi:hypothetical protein
LVSYWRTDPWPHSFHNPCWVFFLLGTHPPIHVLSLNLQPLAHGVPPWPPLLSLRRRRPTVTQPRPLAPSAPDAAARPSLSPGLWRRRPPTPRSSLRPGLGPTLSHQRRRSTVAQPHPSHRHRRLTVARPWPLTSPASPSPPTTYAAAPPPLAPNLQPHPWPPTPTRWGSSTVTCSRR